MIKHCIVSVHESDQVVFNFFSYSYKLLICCFTADHFLKPITGLKINSFNFFQPMVSVHVQYSERINWLMPET